MAFAKFEENRLRIDGEIAENHAILVNLTASIAMLDFMCVITLYCRYTVMCHHVILNIYMNLIMHSTKYSRNNKYL